MDTKQIYKMKNLLLAIILLLPVKLYSQVSIIDSTPSKWFKTNPIYIEKITPIIDTSLYLDLSRSKLEYTKRLLINSDTLVLTNLKFKSNDNLVIINDSLYLSNKKQDRDIYYGFLSLNYYPLLIIYNPYNPYIRVFRKINCIDCTLLHLKEIPIYLDTLPKDSLQVNNTNDQDK